MTAQVFISYSAEDGRLAQILLDLLDMSGVVDRSEVFCFEQPGAQGATGGVISTRIGEALAAPVAIAIITPRYLASNYCVGEFGYLKLDSMRTDRALVPLLMPPLDESSVGAFFSDVGLTPNGASATSLSTVIDTVGARLGRRVNLTLWDRLRQEGTEQMEAALAAMSAVAPEAPSLHTLPAETLGKIVSIRRSRLSIEERDWMYDQFQTLEPQYHVPRASAAPAASQAAHEERRPIDDSVLLGLCEATGVGPPDVRRPLTDDTKADVLRAAIECGDEVSRLVERAEMLSNPTVLKAWRTAYDYLAARESLAQPEEVGATDVVLVPGARKGHVFRADAAATVARGAPNLRLVVFSGGQPIFDDEQDIPFGEADAMAERYSRVYPNSPSAIELRVDNRARTTQETVAHMRVHLQPLVVELGRPVVLTAVTSPYHMRRLIWLVNSSLQGMEHLVSRVQGVLSTASFDWRAISNVSSPEEIENSRYGVGLYVRELSKLYGGRATAEF